MQTSTEQQPYLQHAYRIAEIANSALELESFLQTMVAEVASALAWERVILGLNNESGDAFFTATFPPPASGPTTSPISEPERSLLRFAMLQRNFFLLDTAALEEFDLQQQDAHSSPRLLLKESGFHTVIGYPLLDQEAVLGAIIVGSVTSRSVGPDECASLERIFRLMNSAIIRITLYERSLQSNRLHTALLSRIIHDLRTPTIAITGYADALLKGRYGPIPDQPREAIETIRQSGKRLHRLISDSLAFSKMQAGYFIIDHVTAVDLIPIISHVSRMIQPLLEEKRLTLRHEIEPDLPFVRGNSDQLERILTNLLSNAIKFSETGPIIIRAKRWENNQVRLSVQDHGIGISPEHQALVFEEYRQLKHRPDLHVDSTGLGLAICRMLVDQMGGKISLESALHHGSTFSCDFPIAEPDLPLGNIPGEQTRSGGDGGT